MIFLLLKEDITIKEINFSHFDDHLLVPVFDLLKGLPFNVYQFSPEFLNQLIDFLQFDSLLYFIQANSTDEFNSSSNLARHFFQQSVANLIDFDSKFLSEIISSPFLHLQIENQLFQFFWRIYSNKSNKPEFEQICFLDPI